MINMISITLNIILFVLITLPAYFFVLKKDEIAEFFFPSNGKGSATLEGVNFSGVNTKEGFLAAAKEQAKERNKKVVKGRISKPKLYEKLKGEFVKGAITEELSLEVSSAEAEKKKQRYKTFLEYTAFKQLDSFEEYYLGLYGYSVHEAKASYKEDYLLYTKLKKCESFYAYYLEKFGVPPVDRVEEEIEEVL